MHGGIDDSVVKGPNGDLGAGSSGPAGDKDSGNGVLSILDGIGEIEPDVGCGSLEVEV